MFKRCSRVCVENFKLPVRFDTWYTTYGALTGVCILPLPNSLGLHLAAPPSIGVFSAESVYVRVKHLEDQFAVEVWCWNVEVVELSSAINSQKVVPEEIARIDIQGSCFPSTDEVNTELVATGDGSTCLQVDIGHWGPFLKQVLRGCDLEEVAVTVQPYTFLGVSIRKQL